MIADVLFQNNSLILLLIFLNFHKPIAVIYLNYRLFNYSMLEISYT